MDNKMKATVTDPLMEEFMLAREQADTKPKLTPVHVLNDVSATVAKIKNEVCPTTQSIVISCILNNLAYF